MRKNSTACQPAAKLASKAAKTTVKNDRHTFGVDLGDRKSCFCEMSADKLILRENSVPTTKKALTRLFASRHRARIVIEAGTHSPWISRLLTQLGHEVIVANPRELAIISRSTRKDDRHDARLLARLGQSAPELLQPVRHRSALAQADLLHIRARAALVEARTALVNSARGLAKSAGERFHACDADQFDTRRLTDLDARLRPQFEPLLRALETLTTQIKSMNQTLEQIARDHYPEIARLKQIQGVGTLIALTFMLTLDDRDRFAKSRDVGCYLGLRPKRRESGQCQPELRITKQGDRYLRRLLVQAAQHILSRRGPDTDLKRWGLALAAAGKNRKKRAVVAVARKLAVLLHKLWRSGETYRPLRQQAA